jgi:hypothetical protein
MSGDTLTRTLLDDWRLRRDRLAGDPGPIPQYAAIQIQLLDFLLERYRDAPEAAAPARFVPKSDLFVNERAIVVHHHLGVGVLGGVKSRHEAESRVSGILKRMTTAEAPTETAPDREEPWLEDSLYVATRTWCAALDAIAAGKRAHAWIERALASQPMAPEQALRYLYRCLVDVKVIDTYALDLLAKCQNPSAINYAVLAWRRRIEVCCEEDLHDEFAEFFTRPAVRKRSAERLRAELAADDPRVRLAAIELLARIGELADVGLFSDLLTLPPLADEDPRERPAMLRAMQTIAGAR